MYDGESKSGRRNASFAKKKKRKKEEEEGEREKNKNTKLQLLRINYVHFGQTTTKLLHCSDNCKKQNAFRMDIFIRTEM